MSSVSATSPNVKRESSNMGDMSDTESFTKKKKPAIVQKDISSVFSKLLNTEIDSNPILAKRKGISKRIETEEKEKKLLKKKTALRKQQRRLNHVKPDASTLSYEKALKRIANRGIVKLFNAINSQQKEKEPINKNNFLDLLKSGSKK